MQTLIEPTERERVNQLAMRVRMKILKTFIIMTLIDQFGRCFSFMCIYPKKQLKHREGNVVRRVHETFTTSLPRQFFPGGRKRLFYCILDDKICAKV